MSKKANLFGKEVWEEKIRKQGPVGVIHGSIYSHAELKKRTQEEISFIKKNF